MNFSYANKLVAERTELAMTSSVSVERGDIPQLDEVTLTVGGITNVTVIYSGPAHIHTVNGAGVIDVGQQSIDTRTVQISIPISAPIPRRDDLVRVDSDADVTLPTAIFRVMDVNVGGLLNGYHLMTCQGWTEDRYWF